MVNERNKILLSELYSLRAGLSLISLEKDRLKGDDDRMRSVQANIEDNTASIINYNSIVSTSKKTLKTAKNDYSKAKREYDKKSYPLWVNSIITVCLVALIGYLCYIRDGGSRYIVIYDYVIIGLSVIASLYLLKSLFISFRLRKLRRRIKHDKELMRDSRVWISESERGAHDVEQINRVLSEKRRDAALSLKDTSAISCAIAESLYKAVKDNFATMISTSYFSAVDYLICLVRSGKIDNITAALISADEKKQSGELPEAIINAHEEIINSVNDDLCEISDEIVGAYERLAKKIEIFSRKAIDDLIASKKYISGTKEEIESSFGLSDSKDKLTFALESKIRSSSEELSEDVEYIVASLQSAK